MMNKAIIIIKNKILIVLALSFVFICLSGGAVRAASYPISTQFSAGPASIVATNAERNSAGLSIWPDGNMGFYQYSGQNRMAGPNSGNIGVTQVTSSNLISSVVTANTPISSLKEPANYAGGGPVYNDSANGRLLMFYHGEIWPGGDSNRTWAFIGMAKSTDGGGSWTDLGRIVTPNIQVSSPTYQGPADVLGAPYIIKDGYFYVYFKDQIDDGLYGQTINYAVARASVADVLNAANTGGVASFQKYYGGSFSQPGIGGLSQNIITGFPATRWADVIYLQKLNQYAMVFSVGNENEWWHMISLSNDGINWFAPNALYGKLSQPGLYLSAFSGDYSNPRVATGNNFTFYRVNQYELANVWANANVESMNITFTGSASNGSSSSSKTLAATGKSQVFMAIIASIVISITVLLAAFTVSKIKPKK
jgi:hypothetical protein